MKQCEQGANCKGRADAVAVAHPHVCPLYRVFIGMHLALTSAWSILNGNSLQEPFAANEGLLVCPQGALQIKIVLDL